MTSPVGERWRRTAPTSTYFVEGRIYEIVRDEGDLVVVIDEEGKDHRWEYRGNFRTNFERVVGPVATETVTVLRKRIYPGVYGRLRVHPENYQSQHKNNGVGVSFTMRDEGTSTMVGALNAGELREAAAVLVELAAALDDANV